MADLPLRARIVVAFALVLGVAAAGLMALLPSQIHAVELQWAERRAIALGIAVSDSALTPLDFGDETAVGERLAGMARFPDARYAAVVDLDQHTLGAWGAPARTVRYQELSEPVAVQVGTDLEVRIPMQGKAGGRGILFAVFDQSSLERQHQANVRMIAWSLGGLWLLGLALSWVMGSVLVRPLHEVTRAARSFELGQDLELLPPPTADATYQRDEARVLAQAFYAMTDRIRRQVAELEQQRARAMAAEEEAVRASAAKTQFLANMSHELRTPLNAILGYCELVTDNVEAGDYDEVLPDLGRVRSAARHLLSLINDVLDLAKVEADRLELLIERYDLPAMLRDLASEVDPLVRQNGNTLALTVAPGVGAQVGDALRVRQCVLNLVSNAAKFTRDGRIAIDVSADERWLVISVSDTGSGIAPDTLQRLFQPFVQADASTTRRTGGTGLGLALTRRLCERMGGDVQVESRIGVGSVFTVRLPNRPAPADAAIRPGVAPAA
jgi:signal transduction histidine kinase